jgi:hypothetical protein
MIHCKHVVLWKNMFAEISELKKVNWKVNWQNRETFPAAVCRLYLKINVCQTQNARIYSYRYSWIGVTRQFGFYVRTRHWWFGRRELESLHGLCELYEIKVKSWTGELDLWEQNCLWSYAPSIIGNVKRKVRLVTFDVENRVMYFKDIVWPLTLRTMCCTLKWHCLTFDVKNRGLYLTMALLILT